MGKIRRIHVNQPQLRHNLKTGERHPVIIVRDSDGPTYARRVDILDDSGKVVASVIESIDKPMPGCGARIWIETRNEIVLHEAEASTGCPIRKAS